MIGEAMVVDRSQMSVQVLENPERALRETYRNYYFSSSPGSLPGVCTVKAFVLLPKHDGHRRGSRRLGGIVAQSDFIQSIDPVRFRVRGALGKMQIRLVLQNVKSRGRSLEFIFAPRSGDEN